MRQRIQKARDTEGGFSLVELLIVIAILGTLSGIAVFGVSTFNADAKTTACTAEKRTVQAAADAYLAKTNTAATALDDAAPIDASSVLVSGGYLKNAPNAGLSLTDGVVGGTCS